MISDNLFFYQALLAELLFYDTYKHCAHDKKMARRKPPRHFLKSFILSLSGTLSSKDEILSPFILSSFLPFFLY